MRFPDEVNGRISGIYVITCIVHGKVYVGSAKRLRVRFNTHSRTLRNQTHHNSKLQNAWNKYGPDAFEWKLLEFVPDLADLQRREQHYLDLLEGYGPKGFNLFPTARSALGSRHTLVTRARMAAEARRLWQTPERISKAVGRVSNLIGSKVPPERVAKRLATLVVRKAAGLHDTALKTPEQMAKLAVQRVRDAAREASWTPEQKAYRAAQRQAVYEARKDGRRAARLADIENRRAHENALDKARRDARTPEQVEQDNAYQRARRNANLEVARAKDRARRPAKAVLETQMSPEEVAAITADRNAQARAAHAARRVANVEAMQAKNRAAYAAKKAKVAREAAANEGQQFSFGLAAE